MLAWFSPSKRSLPRILPALSLEHHTCRLVSGFSEGTLATNGGKRPLHPQCGHQPLRIKQCTYYSDYTWIPLAGGHRPVEDALAPLERVREMVAVYEREYASPTEGEQS